MKFQVLLAIVVVIVYCQAAQPQPGDSDTSLVNKGQMSRQQGRLCNCIEGRSGQKLKCPCVPPPRRTSLSKGQNAFCKKKKIERKRCQQLFYRRSGKETKGKTVISTPI